MARYEYFSPKRPGSSELFGFDLVNLLGDAEPITSVTCVVSLKSGTTDAGMGTMASGSPIKSGTKVWQKIGGGLNGNYYFLTFTVTTSNQVIELAGVLFVSTGAT